MSKKINPHTYRANISIPLAVKKRMGRYPEANWSAVAARAFIDHMNKQDGQSPEDARLEACLRFVEKLLGFTREEARRGRAQNTLTGSEHAQD